MENESELLKTKKLITTNEKLMKKHKSNNKKQFKKWKTNDNNKTLLDIMKPSETTKCARARPGAGPGPAPSPAPII